MKSIVHLRAARPPHPILLRLDRAFNVDRLLTRSGKGQFGFDVPHEDVHAGAGVDLIEEGQLITISSTEGCPVYVGIIGELNEDSGSGVVEVSGDNYTSCLYDKALMQSAPVVNRSGGMIARDLLRQAQGLGQGFFIEEGKFTGGATLMDDINFGQQTLGSALDSMAKRLNDEWWLEHHVSPRAIHTYFYYGISRGSDRSNSVYLEEGRDFPQVSFKRDTLGQPRSVIAVGGGGPVESRPSVAVSGTPDGRVGRAGYSYKGDDVVRLRRSPQAARDEITYRVRDSDPTVLFSAAARQFANPLTARLSLSMTIKLAKAAQFRPGDWISCRFFSLHGLSETQVIRANAMQPDESTGECDLSVSV